MRIILILILSLSVSVRVAGDKSLIAFASLNEKTGYSVFNEFNIKTFLYDAGATENNEKEFLKNLRTAQVIEKIKRKKNIELLINLMFQKKPEQVE